MRTLSPVRSASPLQRPKVTFHYPPSPLKERNSNLTPSSPLNIHKSPEKIPLSNVNRSNLESDSCSLCSQPSIYRDLGEGGRKYCSECGIRQRKRGVQIVRIELKDQPFYRNYHQKHEKQNFIHQHNKQTSSYTHDSRLSGHNQARSNETEGLRGQLKIMLAKLSNRELSNEGVREIYREKKMNLKNHYERIKAAIKQSIERDLAELEKRQTRSLQCVQELKVDLSKTVGFKIKDTNKSSQDTQMDMKKLKEKHKMAQNLISQLQVPRQNIAELAHDSLEVRLTNEQISQVSDQLYNPSTFTLFADRPSKTFFSFQQKPSA